MTRTLYLSDSHTMEFTATVVERREHAGQTAIVLDQTCFYPTGGGQPHDVGRLNDAAVVDVFVDETSDDVLHIISGELPDDEVVGVVDRARRRDHMQQHTGQHILSEAFIRELGAQTVSFHLGEEASTIDLNRKDITRAELETVENTANEIVFQNRPVLARFVAREELDQLPLRKPPTVAGPIRVVEVEGFDWSACGGTHCRATGEVGLIRISHSERRGEESRITFLCGRRALEDYRRRDSILTDLAAHLTTGYEALPDVIRKMDDDMRSCQYQLQQAQESLATVEAQTLLANAFVVGGMRVIARAFDDRDFAAVKRLSAQLREQADVIALLGWKGPEKGQVLFTRAEQIDLDMRDILREACKAVGGGGGGRADAAQGGGMSSARVDEALQVAHAAVSRQLT
jgi:alanyl-tRNA synthetase